MVFGMYVQMYYFLFLYLAKWVSFLACSKTLFYTIGTEAERDQTLPWCDLWQPYGQNSLLLPPDPALPLPRQGRPLHWQWTFHPEAQGDQGEGGAVTKDLPGDFGGSLWGEMECLQIQAGVTDTCTIIVIKSIYIQ